MDFKKVRSLSRSNLVMIAKELGLDFADCNCENLADRIVHCFKVLVAYRQRHVDRYTRYEQIGNTGKEGVTYMVKTSRGEQYAMKTFKKTKSIERLVLEATLQDMASRHGISPKIVDVDVVGRTITMEKMDKHLVDVMKLSNGNLQVEQQKRLFEIFKKLDKAEVFHGDSNILNYMLKGDKIYIIDFGMGKQIDGRFKKKLGTNTPNETLMTLAFILKLKELGSPCEAYSYLLSHVSADFRQKYNL